MNESSFNDNELTTFNDKIGESPPLAFKFKTLAELIIYYYMGQPVPKPLKDLILESSKYKCVHNTQIFNKIPLNSTVILVKPNIDLEVPPKIEKGIVMSKKENYLSVVTGSSGYSFPQDLHAVSNDWLIFIEDKSYSSKTLD